MNTERKVPLPKAALSTYQAPMPRAYSPQKQDDLSNGSTLSRTYIRKRKLSNPNILVPKIVDIDEPIAPSTPTVRPKNAFMSIPLLLRSNSVDGQFLREADLK